MSLKATLKSKFKSISYDLSDFSVTLPSPITNIKINENILLQNSKVPKSVRSENTPTFFAKKNKTQKFADFYISWTFVFWSNNKALYI